MNPIDPFGLPLPDDQQPKLRWPAELTWTWDDLAARTEPLEGREGRRVLRSGAYTLPGGSKRYTNTGFRVVVKNPE